MNTIARKTSSAVRIRLATPEDAAAIRAIYAPYVLDTAVTFDTQAPSEEEMRAKITAILAERPFLVAELVEAPDEKNPGTSFVPSGDTGDEACYPSTGKVITDESSLRISSAAAATSEPRADERRGASVLGYSYASPFRPRGAYIHAIETSIYLHPQAKGLGLGRRLYTALEELLRLQNVTTMNACISSIEPPDEYSPVASRLFHERMGYTLCGRIPHCGRKFDRWYDIIWMQKDLGDPAAAPGPFVVLPQLDSAAVEAILQNA